MADQIGSLEVGKKADLVVIDFDRLHTTPNPNPISTLVYAATGGEVDSVMIDGKWIVRGQQLLTMDEEQVKVTARKHAVDLYKRAEIELKPGWPVI